MLVDPSCSRLNTNLTSGLDLAAIPSALLYPDCLERENG